MMSNQTHTGSNLLPSPQNQHRADCTKEQGNFPILVVMMLIFLIGSGLAYMKWSADEGVENKYERAAIHANYLAQSGICERGFPFLRSREPGNLPRGRVDLASGGISGVGIYNNTYVYRLTEHSGGNVFRQTNYYTIYSTGVVTYEDSRGDEISVARQRSLTILLRSFVNYMYLTDMETTIFGEVIKFWTGDTLYGRVHSNEQIAMMGRPVFYGPISTTASAFWHGTGYNPYFAIDPVYNAPAVIVPDEATKVRNCAAGCSQTYESQGIYNHRLVFDGSGYTIYRWEIGTPFDPDSSFLEHGPIGSSDLNTMFFYGPLELMGRLQGRITVGASEDIRLIDDIWYWDSRPNGEVDSNSINVLGIVSEGNILIANTWENGRENSAFGTDIIINAGMIALGESFTFEDQNDDWEIYQGPLTGDERGNIRLWGSVVQKRRGYVHRSNHNGTGYDKDYHYDFRFSTMPPPCYPDATDQLGHSLFDVIAWGY